MSTNSRICGINGISIFIVCLCIENSFGYCGWTTAKYFSPAEIAKKLKSCVNYYYTRRDVNAKLDDFLQLLKKEPKWLGLGLQKNMDDLGTYMTQVEDHLGKFHKAYEKKGHITIAEHLNFSQGFLAVTSEIMQIKIAEIDMKGVQLTDTLITKKALLLDEEKNTRHHSHRIRRILGHLASSHIWLTPLPGNEIRSGPEIQITTTNKGSPYYKPQLFDIKSLELLQYMFSKLCKMNCSSIRNESALVDIMRKYPQEHIQKTKFSEQEYQCTKLKFTDIASTILTYKLSLEQYANYIQDLNEETTLKLSAIEHEEAMVRFFYGFQKFVLFDKYNSLQRSLENINTYYVKTVQ